MSPKSLKSPIQSIGNRIDNMISFSVIMPVQWPMTGLVCNKSNGKNRPWYPKIKNKLNNVHFECKMFHLSFSFSHFLVERKI